MKKNYILTMLAFAAFSWSNAAAQDVYVYKGNGLMPVSTLKSVQRITFANSGIEFLLQNGQSTNFSLDDLDYFTFFDREEESVGITNITDSKSINVTCDGADIIIESSTNISNIEIYSIDGVKLASVKQNGNYARYSIIPYASGIYLVKVIVDGKAITQKIIKK